MRIKFRNWDCLLTKRHYQNDRIALELIDYHDGEPIATATVNVPEIQLQANQVLIKDYSENEGMLTALEKAGIVKSTGTFVQSGFVQIPVCELLIDVASFNTL